MLHAYDLFFFNDTATTEIYTLSLHDALPICRGDDDVGLQHPAGGQPDAGGDEPVDPLGHHRGPAVGDRLVEVARSEEHTSELQSRQYLVCRLLLEKKKKSTHMLDRHAHLRSY